jgi:hypothetical protein
LGRIIPTDYFFFRGVETTNQYIWFSRQRVCVCFFCFCVCVFCFCVCVFVFVCVFVCVCVCIHQLQWLFWICFCLAVYEMSCAAHISKVLK